jgi:hypothetical protein
MSHTQTLSILTTMPWFGWVAIAAIVSGCLSGILKMRYQHLERIEMIRQGMNPDAPASLAKPLAERDF